MMYIFFLIVGIVIGCFMGDITRGWVVAVVLRAKKWIL